MHCSVIFSPRLSVSPGSIFSVHTKRLPRCDIQILHKMWLRRKLRFVKKLIPVLVVYLVVLILFAVIVSRYEVVVGGDSRSRGRLPMEFMLGDTGESGVTHAFKSTPSVHLSVHKPQHGEYTRAITHTIKCCQSIVTYFWAACKFICLCLRRNSRWWQVLPSVIIPNRFTLSLKVRHTDLVNYQQYWDKVRLYQDDLFKSV